VHHAIKPDSSQWLHNISMMDKSDPTFEIPGINLVFLELAKRKKMGNFNFDDPVDRWLSFLTEPEKILSMTKFDLSVYPNLMKAAELLDESNYTQAQLDAYDRHLLAVYDINRSRIESYDEGFDDGMKKGIENGIERGIEKGREEGTQHGIQQGIHLGILQGMHITIAILKDLQSGISKEVIAVKYDISLEEVERLAKEFE
jgi:predicted transposase/invertase (TIGR01784 family)